jgi:hypothetical protein
VQPAQTLTEVDVKDITRWWPPGNPTIGAGLQRGRINQLPTTDQGRRLPQTKAHLGASSKGSFAYFQVQRGSQGLASKGRPKLVSKAFQGDDLQ